MLDRVNQIQEALSEFELWRLDDFDPVPGSTSKAVETLADAARDYADLLTRLEDGSAYEAAAEILHTEFCYDECRWPSRSSWTHAAKPVVDDALGLQEDGQ